MTTAATLIRRHIIVPAESGSACSGCECPLRLFTTFAVAVGKWGVRPGVSSTCRCLTVPPVKVPGVDAWLQRTGNRVGPSLDVGFKEISIQLAHSIQTHLQEPACGTRAQFNLGGRIKTTRYDTVSLGLEKECAAHGRVQKRMQSLFHRGWLRSNKK